MAARAAGIAAAVAEETLAVQAEETLAVQAEGAVVERALAGEGPLAAEALARQGLGLEEARAPEQAPARERALARDRALVLEDERPVVFAASREGRSQLCVAGYFPRPVERRRAMTA